MMKYIGWVENKCYVVYMTTFSIPDNTDVEIKKVFYSKQKAIEYQNYLQTVFVDCGVEIFIAECEVEPI